MHPLLVCPRCGARTSALYTRPGVAGIGCIGRDCLNLSYPTENRLKHPVCDITWIAELVHRARTAKTRNTQGGGDLILWPHGALQPNVSNINYRPGQTVANSADVGLSAGGAMDLFVHVNGTDVIFDVAGYVL
jgi:hypothetical protein